MIDLLAYIPPIYHDYFTSLITVVDEQESEIDTIEEELESETDNWMWNNSKISSSFQPDVIKFLNINNGLNTEKIVDSLF